MPTRRTQEESREKEFECLANSAQGVCLVLRHNSNDSNHVVAVDRIASRMSYITEWREANLHTPLMESDNTFFSKH